jgi:thiol:disulfide interchange protein DsbD
MEEKIFPRPAVARELKENLIEARLHNDGGPRMEENRKLQDEKAGSRAAPIYLIIDPKTGETLRKKAGVMTEVKFLEFLRGKAVD